MCNLYFTTLIVIMWWEKKKKSVAYSKGTPMEVTVKKYSAIIARLESKGTVSFLGNYTVSLLSM